MSMHPYGPDELDRHDPSLDAVADRLERYASDRRDEAPIGLAASIQSAIDEAPDPAIGWWSQLLAGPVAWGAPARGLVTAGVFVLIVAGALAVGQFAQWARDGNLGSSPSAPAVVSPSPSTSPTESPTPSLSPSPSPTETPIPTRTPTDTPAPTPADDDDDDEVETPEPSETDNSGPGGGGDDDGDSSGPGSGDDSGGSGSGSDD
jgi:hypothetical protein